VVPDVDPVLGSSEHALFLTYPLSVPGLEIIYLFNGTSQMNEQTLRKAVELSNAVLDATLFAGPKGGSVPDEVPPSFLEKCTKAVTLPNPTLSFPSWPKLEKVAYEPPVDPASSPGPSFLTGVIKTLRLSVGSIGSSPPSISSPNSVISTFVRPSCILPVHAISINVLVQGTYFASLGELKLAEDCFRWIINLCEGKRHSIDPRAGGIISNREKHVFAYAYYELGILYEGLYKRAVKQGIEDVKPDLINLHKRSIVSVEKLAYYTRKYFVKARSVSGDFNWKMRLQIRVHLSLDALSRSSEGAGASDQTQTHIEISPEAALKMAEDAFYATDDSSSASPNNGNQNDGDDSD
jgi:hypothetical protein